jgi:hypothetical protein
MALTHLPAAPKTWTTIGAILRYTAGRAWTYGGRFPFIFLLLSCLFFSAEYLTRPPVPLDMAAVHHAIDDQIRHLARWQQIGPAPLQYAVDSEIRRYHQAPSGWWANGIAWLCHWDNQRHLALARVIRTITLSLLIVALSTLFSALLAFATAGSGSNRITTWIAAIGLVPAYALVMALGDLLKGLHAGLVPLEITAIAAIAVADGLLPAGARALAEDRRRLAGRDFVVQAGRRLGGRALDRFIKRLALIEFIPRLSGRLAAVAGTISVVGLVPGLYPGTIGGALNLHQADVWLAQSLDILWLLAGALLTIAWILDLFYRRWQRDRKGIDRLDQILHRPRPLYLDWHRALMSLGLLLACVAVVASLHWRTDISQVLLHSGLSLATAIVAGCLGLFLAVSLGLLLPLWSPSLTALLLHGLEAVPRVLGVCFAMTAYNLLSPDGTAVGRWLVWAALLGLFAGSEALRALYSQMRFLIQVDFVEGLRSLGLGPWRVFSLHIWPQMKYRAYHEIFPLVQAVIYCEGAVCILRFVMQGTVVRLFPVGSLLAEGVERFGLAPGQGLLFGASCIGLLVAIAALAGRTLQTVWYFLFLHNDSDIQNGSVHNTENGNPHADAP